MNTAWDIDSFGWPLPPGVMRSEILKNILDQFEESCSGSLAVEWVTLATLVEENMSPKDSQTFMARFHRHILDPALEFLRMLRSAENDRASTTILNDFQDWIVKMQMPHFGAVFTHMALAAAGINSTEKGDTPTWVTHAGEAVQNSAWWSCPHAAVSSQGVVSWCSAALQIPGGKVLDEPGRVYFADDSAEHSILVERMLHPIFLQVPRNAHAERRALIDILRSISRSFAFGQSESWSGVRGEVRLYASHYPCISCLTVLAQFARRLPLVCVTMAFDNAWVAWVERDLATLDPGVFVMGRSA